MRKINRVLAFVLLGISLCACAEEKGHIYKVEKIGTVPTITMDGKPIHGKVLYVHPTGMSGDWLPTEWTEYTIEAVADFDCDNAAVHLRFKGDDFNVYIAKLEVTDLTTGKTNSLDVNAPKPNIDYWCEGMSRKDCAFRMSNTKFDGIACLLGEIGTEASNKLAKTRKQPKGFHFYFQGNKVKAGNKYKVTLKAKADKKVGLDMVFRRQGGDFKTICSLGKKTLEIQTALASEVDVDFVTFPIECDWSEDEKTYNLNHVKEIYDRFVKVNPNVKMIPRIRFYPPQEWNDKYPDDMMKYSDGKIENKFTSIASETYRKACLLALRKIIEFSEKHYAKNMAGYHPTGANTHEWFYGYSWKAPYSGYDVQTLKAFRKWILKKYKDDATLQTAWNNPNVTVKTVEIPSAERRANCGVIIDPKKYADIIDFNLFLQDDMVDIIKILSDETRRLVPHRLVVIFYGYGFEFSSVQNGPAFSGHYGLGKLLKCDSIDILCGPISYSDRQYGGGKSTMGATESITRAGKIWLDEDDTSTYLAPKGNYPGSEEELDTQEKTLKVLKRNLAQQLIRNLANWYMDLGGNGWFADPEFWKLTKTIKAEEEKQWESPNPYNPEVALIYDEASMCYIGGSRVSHFSTALLMSRSREKLNRAAVPFGHYLLRDFLSSKKVKTKLNVFPAAYALDAKDRKKLKQRTKNSANIWAWLPAYVDLDKAELSFEAVKDLTGFDVSLAPNNMSKVLTATEDGLQIGLPRSFGHPSKNIIALIPQIQEGDKVLATFESGLSAIVQRGKDIFYAPSSEIPTELFRYAAKLGGVHIYTDSPFAVYSNGKYLSVTATKDAPCELDLNGTFKVYDVFDKKELGTLSKIELDMKKADIKLFRLD